MRTILVMTDFSIRADHATYYALKLAQKIKANLVLCNVYPAPVVQPNSPQVSWISNGSESLAEDSINDLNELTGRLNAQLDNSTAPGEFKPDIEPCSKPGSLAGAINEISATRHVLMAVISTHYSGGFGDFLAEDHTSEIIEKADVPVLVVPYQLSFKGFGKIAFATDLTRSGIDILHCLHGLTKYFDSEILITYVADEKLSDQAEHTAIQNFFKLAASKVNYSKIYYRAIHSKSVTSGLDWLTEYTDIDLLVLVHRKRNFLQKMLEGSVTQKMADHLVKPMLVFPGAKIKETLPMF